MERKLLRGVLYVVAAVGIAGGFIDSRDGVGNPAASFICGSVALAGLAASAREREGAPKPPPLPRG